MPLLLACILGGIPAWLYTICSFFHAVNCSPGRFTMKMGRKIQNRQRRNGNTQQKYVDAAPLFRVPRSLSCNFVRTYGYGVLGKSGTADIGYGFAFRLSDTPSFGELTNLFDAYKITLVEAIWELTSTSANVSGNTVAFPTVLAYPDYDDATAPTTLAAVEQVQRMERLQFSSTRNQLKRSIVPRVLSPVVVTGGTTNNAAHKPNQWLDCSWSAVEHYGLKFWVKNYSTSFDNTIQLSFRYHITCRDAR
jgi:hypothetical protein